MWTLCFICSWIIPVALPASLWVKVFRSGEWFCPWDCAPELRVESRVFPLYRQLCPSKAGPGAGQGQVESPESACARGGVWGGVSSGPAPSFTVESWSVVWPLDSRHISVWDLCVCPVSKDLMIWRRRCITLKSDTKESEKQGQGWVKECNV